MKHIAVIGSTGSIGRNALEVIAAHPHEFSVFSLAAKNNVRELVEQAKKFCPRMITIYDEGKKNELIQSLAENKLKSTQVFSGREGLIHSVIQPEIDQVLLALSGAEGLHPLIAALRARKSIALANKEPLVMAGDIIHQLAHEFGAQLIPVDSEHSGIFQCLEGRNSKYISRIFLTASGGPFLKRDLSTFEQITAEEAIQHPRWNMGKKISVDSATLMNKGLEVIEASSLFNLDLSRIEVLIHPEAVVHAIVEFEDASQIAQMSVTDMKLPIQYALSYPKRLKLENHQLNLKQIGSLHFQPVDLQKFPCLMLAYAAGKKGGTAPCVLNAANEVCVDAFLGNEIGFTEIPKIIDQVLNSHPCIQHPNLEDILKADHWARNHTSNLIHMKVNA